jgi:broad specificity phosphatase PhoE
MMIRFKIQFFMRYTFINILIITLLFTFNSHALEKGGKKSVVIYFVRHGKTIFNTLERVQGWSDSPLTPEGVEVAEDLGRGLKDIVFGSVYTSDAGRQRETAKLIMKYNNKKKVPFIETTDLREWYFGSFEGDLNKNMYGVLLGLSGGSQSVNPQQKFKDMSIPQMADGFAQADPKKEAENWLAIETRVKRALETITKEASSGKGGNVLVVTSGLTISSILFVIDPSQKRLGAENASVSRVIYKDGKYVVESFNDLNYVAAGKRLR